VAERGDTERHDAAVVSVMPGLDPGIHDFLFFGQASFFRASKDVDGRVKPGHDE